eukprot:scaffold336237_cov49-Prasinocladus_malaysianus.AAC.1
MLYAPTISQRSGLLPGETELTTQMSYCSHRWPLHVKPISIHVVIITINAIRSFSDIEDQVTARAAEAREARKAAFMARRQGRMEQPAEVADAPTEGKGDSASPGSDSSGQPNSSGQGRQRDTM